ncbi:ApeI family dehydratase [Shewanella surugensis]|uniref:Thioester dehydrase n=1 Tax=Shewanella surugensis TaxID=212020 RepID=A0ABT0LB55_9GAMM|nr:thioester dehydrase [Shewanella surugensis]MCL1124600.1 thioester dehydrase [Shewanella surugensis]
MIKSSLPDIISRDLSATSATWRLRIDKNLPYFNGHFNEQPVLPGITQLDWAIRLGCQHFDYPNHIPVLEVLKFQNLMLPGSEVDLTITLDEKKQKLSFIYSDKDIRFASGRIVMSTKNTNLTAKVSSNACS